MKKSFRLPFGVLDLVLKKTEGYEGWLTGTFHLGNISMHVEAIEVVASDDGTLAVDSGLQDRIEGVRSFDDYGSHYETLKLAGKDYFLVIYPFQL